MEKIVVIGNGIDWLDSCYSGYKNDNVIYINDRIPMKVSNKAVDFIIRCWFSVRDKRRLVRQLPFRQLWFRFSSFCKQVSEEDHIIFIIYDHNRISLDKKYIKWLREKYKDCSVSYVFTNIASKSGAGDYGMITELNSFYDHVFAFDEQDSQKYGFEYNYLIYAPKMDNYKRQIDYDCLFVGNAKERLDLLHSIYKKVASLGLRPCFYINGVSEELQLKDSDIVYNQRIPYSKTLELLLKSKCIIDVLQDDSTGVTLRVCESVVWNKLIITDNKNLINEEFYSTNNICVIQSPDDIRKSFFDNTLNADHKFAYLFSPEYLFEKAAWSPAPSVSNVI